MAGVDGVPLFGDVEVGGLQKIKQVADDQVVAGRAFLLAQHGQQKGRRKSVAP